MQKRRANAAAAGVRPMPTMEMGDMGSPKIKVLVILVVAGVINLGYWYKLDHRERRSPPKWRPPKRRTANWLK